MATQTDDVETVEFSSTKEDIRFFQSKDPNCETFDHTIDFGSHLFSGERHQLGEQFFKSKQEEFHVRYTS